MVASCCQVVIFIMYLSFMNVPLLLCGSLELYYVSCVCGFVSFMTCERSQRNKNFVMLVLLRFVICELVMIDPRVYRDSITRPALEPKKGRCPRSN